jgi:FkbM family methyltransferase
MAPKIRLTCWLNSQSVERTFNIWSPIKNNMRGVRLIKSYVHRTKLLLGAARQLKNWRQLREMAQRAKRGEAIAAPPVLEFRNGLRIQMVPASHACWDFLFEEIFLDHCYQPSPDFIPRRGWTVIDLGANMGFFTCQAAAAAPEVHVVSVEPMEPYQLALKKNVSTNQFSNVTVIEGAICGEADQIIPLTVWYTAAGELRTGTVQSDAVRVETVMAKGYTLAQVFELGKVERCDLLKVDIEGAEYGLFESVTPALWAKISRVVMEVHQDQARSAKQITRILEANQFTVHVANEACSTPLLWAARSDARQT